jgi:hypothetical protein
VSNALALDDFQRQRANSGEVKGRYLQVHGRGKTYSSISIISPIFANC